MRKLISLFLLGMFFLPSTMAATSVHVKVSFTIPQRLEICDQSQTQTKTNMDAAPSNEQPDVTTIASTIVRADRVYLMQTVLPR
jgi:hypothetical protein